MTNGKIHTGYVIGTTVTGAEYVLLQFPSDNRWGFEIADDDQSWAGGFGVYVGDFEAIGDDDGRITDEDRERLQDVLDDFRADHDEA